MPNDYGVDVSDEAARELTRLLLGSVDRLIALDQYNHFIRLQAIDDPFKFITDVSKHADVLEKEDESKGYPHFRITGVTPEGNRNKISCIKFLRQMMGWGLADSKYSFERLPGGSDTLSRQGFTIVSSEFFTQESLEASQMWKDFLLCKHYFNFDIVRLPAGTLPSQPASSNT